MLEKLTYQNHLNETFDFGKDGIYVNAGELHNYAWSVEKRNNRISALRRDVVTTRKLPVVIICQDEAAAITARNKLFETVEKDVLAGEYGKIILNGYYFRCFVTQSKKKDYLKSGSRYMQLDLVLTTDRPVWVREEDYRFDYMTPLTKLNHGVDYPTGYNADYAPNSVRQWLNNTGIAAANFQITFYGNARSPEVVIGGHSYKLNTTIAEGEYAVIDSITKTITLHKTGGVVENIFSKRNRSSYIFKPIPPGNNELLLGGDYYVKVKLYDERSEPLWI